MLVLASSTGGIGAHVAGLAGRLVAAGVEVLVCGPAATEKQFRFTERGASFTPVEIPANLHPRDMRAVRALRQLCCATNPTWCTRTGCVPGWSPRSPGRPSRSW